MQVLVTLTSAVDALLDAASSALEALPNEDMRAVEAQARATSAILPDLICAAETRERDAALRILHTVNNKLTGVLSLTMLAREDLEGEHTMTPLLLALEDRTRIAADAARAVATMVKSAD